MVIGPQDVGLVDEYRYNLWCILGQIAMHEKCTEWIEFVNFAESVNDLDDDVQRFKGIVMAWAIS